MKTSVSNATAAPMDVWIEPWCDELILPPRATLSFEPRPPEGVEPSLPDLEMVDGMLQIWAASPGRAIVEIDGVEQDTCCGSVELPAEIFTIPIKKFVDVAFGQFPEARPGGARILPKSSLWTRIFGRK